MGAAANASRELMGYHSVDLKKSRADRQHKGVAGEEWRRRQSEVVEACKVTVYHQAQDHGWIALPHGSPCISSVSIKFHSDSEEA